MSELTATQRLACRELVLGPHTSYEIVERFLEQAGADGVLSLAALFRAVRRIPDRVSDPGVALAKLAWWRSELHAARSRGSQHPVIGALNMSGRLATLDEATWSLYLAGVARALEGGPAADFAQCWQRLQESSGLEALMLCGLPARHPAAGALRALGAAGELQERLNGLFTHPGKHHWLPLDTVARHGIGDTGRPAELSLETVVEIARQLAGQAREWLAAEPPAWKALAEAGADPHGLRCLAIRHAVEARRLGRLAQGRGPGSQWHSVAEVLAAWRVARRLPPSTGGQG